jgi:hypothetical protein
MSSDTGPNGDSWHPNSASPPDPAIDLVSFGAAGHMGDLIDFMRCNPQHHSFAIARGPHVSLHHASFQTRGIDEYMRGTGRVLRAG